MNAVGKEEPVELDFILNEFYSLSERVWLERHFQLGSLAEF